MIKPTRRGAVRQASTTALQLLERQRSLRFRPKFQRLEDRTLLSSISWNTTVSPTGGSWDVGSNWVGGVVPGSTNDVVIDLTGAGTVTLNGSATDSVLSLTTNANTSLSIGGDSLSLATTSTIGGNLTLTSGTLTGAGTLTVTGTTTWSGGTMTGTGSTTIASGATLTLSGTTDVLADGRTLGGAGFATLTGELNAGTGGGTLNFSALQWSSTGGIDLVGNTLKNAGRDRAVERLRRRITVLQQLLHRRPILQPRRHLDQQRHHRPAGCRFAGDV